jgi:hypothetical protein
MKAKKDAYDVAPIPAADLTEKELAACIAVIKKGPAVDWRSALRELPLATAVVIARKGREIVGVGAIKRERQEYAAKISRDSDVPFSFGHARTGIRGCRSRSSGAWIIASHYERTVVSTRDDCLRPLTTSV